MKKKKKKVHQPKRMRKYMKLMILQKQKVKEKMKVRNVSIISLLNINKIQYLLWFSVTLQSFVPVCSNPNYQLYQKFGKISSISRLTEILSNDKKCINKEERVRHLPGYCP